MNIKQDIEQIRLSAGLSQEQIADKIGISQQVYSNFIAGRTKKADPKILLYLMKEQGLTTNVVARETDTPYIVKKPRPSKNPVKFYDIDFLAGSSPIQFYDDTNMIEVAYEMDIPEFAGCIAFRAYSDSMEPLIKSGSILFGTKIEDWITHLEYGQIYGIVCNDGRRYLKYIRRHKDHERFFLLRSENAEMYDEFEIPKEIIKNIWLINGWLNRRT